MNKPCKQLRGERREKFLHRLCGRVQTMIDNGTPTRTACRHVAQYQNEGVALPWITLRDHYYRWKRKGKKPEIFRLRYGSHGPVLKAANLICFLNYIVKCPQPSLRTAYEAFMRARGFVRAGKRLKVSYGQLVRSVKAKNFYRIQAAQAAIKQAELKLGALHLVNTLDLQRRFPERPRRQRITRGMDFQI
jgi:hypothetical protein